MLNPSESMLSPSKQNLIAPKRNLIAPSRKLIAPKLYASARLKKFFAQQEKFPSQKLLPQASFCSRILSFPSFPSLMKALLTVIG
jgi:hypothetical protein